MQPRQVTSPYRTIQPSGTINMRPDDPPPKRPLLGRVLVTGGCGFLGYHLVGLLLADPTCGHVYVLDPSTSSTTNAHSGASYIAGCITDAAFLTELLSDIQPTVIFHTASPSATYPPNRAVFHKVNVLGTRALLAAATANPAVQALVYTSSIDIYAHSPHGALDRATEAHPLWPYTDSSSWWVRRLAAARYGLSEYDRTKTVAHKLVLAANLPKSDLVHGSGHRHCLKTAAIVPAHIWGVRDRQGLSLFFDAFEDPFMPLWRVGSGLNINSVVEAGNCAAAHVLAAKALVEGPRKGEKDRIAGEAFNVTDGGDVNFWDDVMLTVAMIRSDCQLKNKGALAIAREEMRVYVIPAWLMRALVWFVKWLFLIFTLGLAEPKQALNANGYSWATADHTLDDRKAREVLGYRPQKFDQAQRTQRLHEAVEFEKQRRRALAAEKLD